MGLSDVMKNGWHPESKSGGKESWRKDFKGVNQVAGWMGHGKDDAKHLEAAHNRSTQPRSALKDPASFGAPPKHRDYYGEEAAAASAPSSARNSVDGRPESPAAPAPTVPVASSHPHPLSSSSSSAALKPGPAVPARSSPLHMSKHPGGAHGTHKDDEEEEEKPTGPFRVDTTGLSTSNLPPPPQHRDKRVVPGAPVSAASASAHGTPTPARSVSPAQQTAAHALRPGPPPPPRVAAQVSGLSTTTAATAGATKPAAHATPPVPSKPKPAIPPRVPARNTPALPNSPPPPYSERPNPVTNAAPAVGELAQRFASLRARQEEREREQEQEQEHEHEHEERNGAGPPPPPVPLGTKPR